MTTTALAHSRCSPPRVAEVREAPSSQLWLLLSRRRGGPTASAHSVTAVVPPASQAPLLWGMHQGEPEGVLKLSRLWAGISSRQEP